MGHPGAGVHPTAAPGQAGDARGSHQGSAWDAEGEEPVSGHRDVSAVTASASCSITWMGPSILSCLSFPPARGAAAPAVVQPLAPTQPCARGAACHPCPAAGLPARQDTSSSCLFLGVRTSSSQPSTGIRAGSVTTQTHKPVGVAAGSPRRRDGAARGEEGADPKTHPTLCSTTKPAFTQQPSVPALPMSCCLRCLCCWLGSVGRGCRGQRWP